MWCDTGDDGKIGSDVVLLVYFLRVNKKNLKSS